MFVFPAIVTIIFTSLYAVCLVTTMFLRKLLNKNDAKPEQKTAPPPGMQTMGASLQKRFAKGVQYNSKYICNVGLFDFSYICVIL